MQDTMKVLVVEDEIVIALNLEHKLKGLGYAVVGIAASGEAAVALALEERPDVVLMHIHLEGEGRHRGRPPHSRGDPDPGGVPDRLRW